MLNIAQIRGRYEDILTNERAGNWVRKRDNTERRSSGSRDIREAWARMWHTMELILPHNQHLQIRTESRERLLWIFFLKPISWYAFATIDPRSRQNSLMFCNASPRAMEPSDKIYTSLPLSMLEAKPSCLSQKWGPDKINVSLSGSFSFMEYDEGF